MALAPVAVAGGFALGYALFTYTPKTVSSENPLSQDDIRRMPTNMADEVRMFDKSKLKKTKTVKYIPPNPLDDLQKKIKQGIDTRRICIVGETENKPQT
jgi:hypothetical protein